MQLASRTGDPASQQVFRSNALWVRLRNHTYKHTFNSTVHGVKALDRGSVGAGQLRLLQLHVVYVRMAAHSSDHCKDPTPHALQEESLAKKTRTRSLAYKSKSVRHGTHACWQQKDP